MLQLAVIRQQADFVKERLRVKNFDAVKAVDTILSLDEQRKQAQLQLETSPGSAKYHFQRNRSVDREGRQRKS